MSQQEINVYEALPLLREVLNVSGFTKIIGRTPGWFNLKERIESPFERLPVGFTEDNIELLNYGLEKVVECCEKHRLHRPSSCSNREVYNTYVKTELKELRKLISMVYIRENFTTIAKSSWSNKMNNVLDRGRVSQFSEKDIDEINLGIDKITELIRTLKITL